MEKPEMTVEEHIHTAIQFLEHSDREFDNGDALQGSEKLWGAASHAIMGLALQRGWKYSKYSAREFAVDRIAHEMNDPLLVAEFSVAQKFHLNFYRDFLEDSDISRDRPLVHHFVRRITEIAKNGPVG